MPDNILASAVTSFQAYIDPATGNQLAHVVNDPLTVHVFNGITNPVIISIDITIYPTLDFHALDAAIISAGASQNITVQTAIPQPLPAAPVVSQRVITPPSTGGG